MAETDHETSVKGPEAPAGVDAADAPLSASRREDVVNAYRAFLGRNPENEAVVERNLRRTPAEIAAILIRSPEFRSRLGELASGRVTPHANLPPPALAEAILWASGLGLLEQGAAAALEEASPARLLAGLLSSPLGRAEAERQPESLAMPRDPRWPERTALHLLTRPAEEEDALRLGQILLGAEAEGAEAMPPGATLLQLLRSRIGQQARPTDLLPRLLGGQVPPIFGLTAEEAGACALWLDRRMGIAVPQDSGHGGLSLGALLVALLRHPVVQDLLDRIPTLDQAAVASALADVETGALLLRTRKATPEDVNLAYLTLLGRPAESESVRQNHAGGELARLAGNLIGSPEFRAQILGRLTAGKAIPHLQLSLEERRAVDAWLAGRLGLPAWSGRHAATAQRLHGMALLARATALPALDRELARRHGELWSEARAALSLWLAGSARGLAGGIDYVTGDWVAGWALDRRQPESPLAIEVHCNDRLVAFGRADRPRLAQTEDEAEGSCGFRLAWRGRSALRAAGPGAAFRFEIRDAASGERIGAAFELDAIFADARGSLQRIATQLEEVKRTVRQLEAMLPQLESFAAFPPEDHATFRRLHRVAPPPALPGAPAVRILALMSCRGVPARGLRRILDALSCQTWPHWEAVLLVASAEERGLAEAAAARDPRLRWRAVAEDGPEAENAAAAAAELAAEEELAAAASGPDALVLMLPPGAEPAETAFAWFAHAAARFPACLGFFCDEDQVEEDPAGPARHDAPVFRAALDPWELPLRNPCGEVLAARPGAALAAALEAAAAAGPDRAARRWVSWAALARQGPVAHIPRLLVAMQKLAAIAAETPAPPTETLRPLLRKPWLLDPGGVPAEAVAAEGPITVIIPTRNGGALLADALGALCAKAAEPSRLDPLVVDNGSDEAATLAWLAAGQAAGRFRLLRVDEPFNWSRLNNLAVAATPAEPGGLVLFLNDDTRMLSQGWDRTLRALLADGEAGAVGARLVYEDLTIQHAGVVIGQERLAAHEGVGEAMDAPGPEGRWQRLRQAGAVTGAFLACRREVFDRLGPFDEQGLGVTFNDVDFCLRVRAAGLGVLYAPDISLVHFESKSRGIDTFDARKRERAEFERRKLEDAWGEGLWLDPGVNPHWARWTAAFAAIREPSAAEIAAHMALSAAPRPWQAGLRRGGGDMPVEAGGAPPQAPPGGRRPPGPPTKGRKASGHQPRVPRAP